jgi:hypothetical protein
VGVYTSVPTFNGRGIKPDGADDLIKMPVTFDPNQDFTVFIAADVGTGMPTGYKTLWSLGNSAANVYISLTKLVTSGHLLFDLYNGTDNISIKINLENLRAGIRLYRLQRKNNKLYVKEMFGASSVESALITANTVVDLQTLFAKGTSSYTYYTDAEENFMAQFNYACSDSESLKIGNHIRKILLQRGVDIA